MSLSRAQNIFMPANINSIVILYKACLSKENQVGWRVGMATMWPLFFPILIAMSWLLTDSKRYIPGEWSPLNNSASKF